MSRCMRRWTAACASPPADGERPLEARLLDPRGREVLRAALPLAETVARPNLWSAETPSLYTLEVRRGGETDSCKVGFRTVAIEGGLLRVNGEAIQVNGVNRHDHDDRRGRAVTRELMELDAHTMKRHNVNAVRCSHYPNDPYWLDLCDRSAST